MNAYDHVLALADQLVEQGRTVEIDEEPDSIRIYARPRALGENTIAAHAFRLSSTGRWNFGGIRAYRTFGQTIVEKRRSRAHIIASTYGGSFIREEATA